MRELQPVVYIMACGTHGTLYIGVTSQLLQRAFQHRTDMIKGFSSRYQVHRLVWFEPHETMESAILREKQLKKWNRAWKLRLIRERNPGWEDLYLQLVREYQGN
jgi:putative endonuclease